MLIHSDNQLLETKETTIDNSVESEEEDFDNLCFICYEKLEEGQNITTLKCNHRYHYNCILLVFKSILQKSTYAAKECPYCRTTTNYLPLIPGIQPIKFIHQEYKPLGKSKIQFIPGKCKYMLKRGPKAGHQCASDIKTEGGYCKKHQKFLDSKNKNQSETDSNPSTINSSS